MRGLVAALALLLACTQPARVRYEEQLEEASPSEAHAIHAARLQHVMRSMDRLMAERLPKPMDEDWERQQRVEELAEVARAIAASASWIRQDGGSSAWSPAEQSAFSSRALELEERAGALGRQGGVYGCRSSCAAGRPGSTERNLQLLQGKA